MEKRIQEALEGLFQTHRILFWYDEKRELRSCFDALKIEGVEKVILDGNEFGLKHRLIREEPNQKFLLYKEGPEPEKMDNWLLDIQLAHRVFQADQNSLWLSELGLGHEFSHITRDHNDFFKSKERREGLKRLLKLHGNLEEHVKRCMLAVCVGSEPRLNAIIERLFSELAQEKEEKGSLVARVGLDSFLWSQLSKAYDYAPKEEGKPSIKDFLFRLFWDCFEMSVHPGGYHEARKKDLQTGARPSFLSSDAQIFLHRLKDSRRFESDFEIVSGLCSHGLDMEKKLAQLDTQHLLDVDYFQLIDQKILGDLVRGLLSGEFHSEDVSRMVRKRRLSHWYTHYQDLYNAVDYAGRFLETLKRAHLNIKNMGQGVSSYISSWYLIDQLYRKCITHIRRSGQASLFGDLLNKIEDLYVNRYLLKLGDTWQSQIDASPFWGVEEYPLQKNFFKHHVEKFLDKRQKICVIISDAMRYEVGEELMRKIRRENRYEVTLEATVSMLPSYTQLGMAALLPNGTLAVDENDQATVRVDGRSASGLVGRQKILSARLPERAMAAHAKEIISLKGDALRDMVKGHDLIYIYHNHIDETGKRETEERVFEAVEETFTELVALIKKLVNANVNNMLVTSDHGFIYQNRPIEESDFSLNEVTGDQIISKDRRFVMGHGLHENPSFRKYSARQLWLGGTMEVQIPKSINRLRLRGSGSRYIHGGASLQEIVLPILKINKKRASGLSCVDVSMIQSDSSIISTGQITVKFYQVQPISETIGPRILRAGLYTESDELISESHDLSFDFTSEAPRDRELPIRFVLKRTADKANGQDVTLRLDERVSGTSQFKEYASIRYRLSRSIISDFDF